ncbi:4777_t:CDS:2 [Dentiscutata heterogama]|uniref:4777_t:CDS:1 n=1 Tax=Dentiscutata heterogama TaxID=1316150 RepID=A0ACA9K2I6_9GLOM|nr:4777_t:CDS:2 [Dentiscutata heterogama]
MEFFQLTIPLLRNLFRVQEYIRSLVATIHITDTTMEFLNDHNELVKINSSVNEFAEGELQRFRFSEDLQRLGDPALELEKPEEESWSQQIDYLCIRLQFCQLDRIKMLKYYYLLGKRMAMFNWNAYARGKLRQRITQTRYKRMCQMARRTYELYQAQDAHNIITSLYLSANALGEMNPNRFGERSRERLRHCGK